MDNPPFRPTIKTHMQPDINPATEPDHANHPPLAYLLR
jgi:hypothetical protein